MVCNSEKFLRLFSQSNSYKTASQERVCMSMLNCYNRVGGKCQGDYREILLAQTEILPGLQDRIKYHCVFLSGMFLHHDLGQNFKFMMKSSLLRLLNFFFDFFFFLIFNNTCKDLLLPAKTCSYGRVTCRRKHKV